MLPQSAREAADDARRAGRPAHGSKRATIPAPGGLIVVRADVLVGSALLHGAAVALFVHWLPAPPPTRIAAPRGSSLPIEVSEPPVFDVVVLDELPALPIHESPAPRGGTHAATTHALTSSTHEPGASPHEPTTTTGGEPGPHAPGGADLFHMRGADLALAPGVAEHIAAGGPDLPGRAHESGKLENVPGGGAVIHDRVTTVDVEPDGTAHFHDKPDVDLHWHLPVPHLDLKQDLHELGDALQEWYRDPYAGTRYGTTSELSELAKAVPGACDTWGDPMCDDPFAPEVEKRAKQRSTNTVSYGGTADLTAWLYRKYAHGDPYSSRKAKLLDDTRDERVERGAAFRAEQQARSAELMQRSLEELWAREPDPVARRRALYELWSDCADDEAGARARVMVIGWIRAKLPAGSGDAYTAEELAGMAPFAPYAP